MIKVDYHFHPNLIFFSKILSNKRSKKIWKSFSKHNLDVVFVSEHVYNRPRSSYDILLANKPLNSTTYIVPAIEYLTKEGVDVIVFSKKPEEIYSHKKLLEPYLLSVSELVDFIISKSELYGIVVHPHTPGTTSIVRKCENDITCLALRKLGFLEVYNGALSVTKKIIEKTGLKFIFKNKYNQIVDSINTPDYLKTEARMFTGGSDAHYLFDLGDCMHIDAEKRGDYDYLFEVATNKSGIPYIDDNKKILGLIPNSFTVAKEWLIKNLKLYKIDKPYE